MLNRPLPATPTGEKRERHRSKVKSERKSTDSEESPRSRPVSGHIEQSPGGQCETGRPVSVQYQNDTLQYGGFDNIDGSVYAGPPTPRR